MTLVVDLAVPGRLSLSATTPPGAVVAVIGPNGAGKSTLLRAVAGLVACEGEVVVDVSRRERAANVGHVGERAAGRQ